MSFNVCAECGRRVRRGRGRPPNTFLCPDCDPMPDASTNFEYKARRRKLDPWKAMYQRKKYTAKEKGIPFTLTLDWVRENAGESCPVTGIPWRFECPDGVSKLYNLDPCLPTFDRIDSDGGYTQDNTRIISWQVNYFKRHLHPEQLEWMCRCILEDIENRRSDD